MRVNFLHTEMTGYHEEYRLDLSNASKTACMQLCGFEQVFDYSQKLIGVSTLRPSHDVSQVGLNHLRNLPYRIDFKAHHAREIMFQDRVCNVALFRLNDLVQLLRVDPDASRSLDSYLGVKGKQTSGLKRLELDRILKQRSAYALGQLVKACFEVEHLGHVSAGETYDMNLVELASGARLMFSDFCAKGRRSINARRGAQLAWTFMVAQILDEMDPPDSSVGSQGYVSLARGTQGLFIDKSCHNRVFRKRTDHFHELPAHRQPPMKRIGHSMRDDSKQYRDRLHQYEAFWQQHESVGSSWRRCHVPNFRHPGWKC
jgi:hypothetical protein